MPGPVSLTARTTDRGSSADAAELDGRRRGLSRDAVHRLDAVHQQVHHDLLELHAIAVHQRQVVGRVHAEGARDGSCSSRPTSSATSFDDVDQRRPAA